MLGEKVWWELHKDAVGCFEQIPEAAPYKTAVVQSLCISQIIQVRSTKDSGHCWRRREELINGILQWIPTHGHTSISWPTKSYIHQFCADTRGHVENLSLAMVKKAGWWESQENPCYWHKMMMKMIADFSFYLTSYFTVT